MSAKGQLLQDPFLNTLRKEHIPVSIYLVNGIKLQGHIDSFDQYVVLLKNTVTQMVYKHSISTVVPARAVTIFATAIMLRIWRNYGNEPRVMGLQFPRWSRENAPGLILPPSRAVARWTKSRWH